MTDVARKNPQHQSSGSPKPKNNLGGFLAAGGLPEDETKKQREVKRIVDACSGDKAIGSLLTAAKEDRLESSSPANRKGGKSSRMNKKRDPLASRSDHMVTSATTTTTSPCITSDLDEQQHSGPPTAKPRKKWPSRSKSTVDQIASSNSGGDASGETPTRRRMPLNRCKSMDEKTAPQRIPRSLVRSAGKLSKESGRPSERGGGPSPKSTNTDVATGKKRRPKKKEEPKESHDSSESPTSVAETLPLHQQKAEKKMMEYGKSNNEDEDKEEDDEEEETPENDGIMQFDPTADNHCLLVDRHSDHFPSQTVTLDIDHGYEFDEDEDGTNADNNGAGEDEEGDRKGRFFSNLKISFNAKFKSKSGCENKPEENTETEQPISEKRGFFSLARQYSGRWSSDHSGHVEHEMLDDNVDGSDNSFS